MTTFDNIFSEPRADPSCCPVLFIVVFVVVFFFLRQPRQPLTTFFPEPCEDPSCCPLLFIVVPVVVLFFLFRAPRGPLLLSLVVYCCFCCRFLLSVPRLARTPLVVLCCLLLFLLSFSSFFSEPREEPLVVPSCRFSSFSLFFLYLWFAFV